MQQERNNLPIVSLPNSLREKLQRAQNLLDQSDQAESYGDHSLAVVKAREAMNVVQRIAQTSPEAAALILLADLGYQGFEIETMERIDQHQVIEHTLFGIPIGTEVINVPTIKLRKVRARIF